jgi:hypothetical protein
MRGRVHIDLTGQRFGLALVRSYSGLVNRSATWACLCDCGKEFIAYGPMLRKGRTKSCGCFKAGRLKEFSTTHDDSGSREHRIWAGIKQRCLNPAVKAFAEYGARGITVCERWAESYEAFLADMGRAPSAAHSIERKRNGEGYSPSNCVWATSAEQARNRRSNVLVEYGGREMVLKDAAEAANLPYKTVHARIANGWSATDALSRPVRAA